MPELSNLLAMLLAEIESPRLLACSIVAASPILWHFGRIMFRGMGSDPSDPWIFDWPLFLLPPLWILRVVWFLIGSLGVIVSLYKTGIIVHAQFF